MRLVIARCSVDYAGRLSAHLPPAVRLLMVKADGSVSIHADDRAYKPLNWMSPPCRIEEAPGVWRVVNKAGEELRITLDEVFHDSSHELGIDPGLVKDGVEAHLQELLAANPSVLGEMTLVRREYPTAVGPVDLLCRDGQWCGPGVGVPGPGGSGVGGSGVGNSGPGAPGLGGSGQAVPAIGAVRHWAVEIKRVAGIDAVEQLTRYRELLDRDPLLAPVGGILAAQEIKLQARTLATDRGLRCVVVDYQALRGMDRDDLTLF